MLKKFLALFLILMSLGASNSFAMRTPLFTLQSSTISTSAVNYASIQGSSQFNWTSNESTHYAVIPYAGIFKELQVKAVGSVSPGQFVIALRVNSATTTLTCTLTATTCSDLTNVVSVSPGDLVNYISTPSSSPTAQSIQISVVFEGTTAGTSIMLAGISSNMQTDGTANYSHPQAVTSFSATEVVRSGIATTSGRLGPLYVKCPLAPGSGKSYAFTVRKNAGATSLTCTVSDANTTCSDTNTSNYPSIVAGDLIAIEAVASGTPTATNPKFGVGWNPTHDGEAMLMFVSNGNPTDTFSNTGIGVNSWNATETNMDFTLPFPIQFRHARSTVTNAPGTGGSGKAWNFIWRVNAASSAINMQIFETATSQTDTDKVNTVTGDKVNWYASAISSPGAPSTHKFGLTMYVPEPTTLR